MIKLYLDPSTGGLVLTLMISLFSSVAFYLINSYRKVLFFFKSDLSSRNVDFGNKLILFNEGRIYWNVFQPVIKYLIQNNKDFVYMTCDKLDPGLKLDSDLCSAFFIGNNKEFYFYLNNIKAGMIVSSTPQLNIFEWKRSPLVSHYCYISHAPMDVHANKKFSFDYYDSILCGNEFQIENLKYLEKKRNSQRKIFYKTGCTYYDNLDKIETQNDDFILLAPTWGDRTFLFTKGELIIEELIESGNNVILRPHPQSWISDKKKLEKIIKKFNSRNEFIVDNDTSNKGSLSKCKLLITDRTSGMICDLLFLTDLPIIVINHSWCDEGYESSDLIREPSTNLLIRKSCLVLEEFEIKSINKYFHKAKRASLPKKYIDEHIYNFKNSGKVAASQIISIHKKILGND